jgi:aminoglycoside phosphotransferase (APT) family kinase protein
VARPVASCDDTTVIGVPFYIMARVDGVLLQDSYPEAIDNSDARREMCINAVETLARLHGVDWRARGLTTPPDPYLVRQLRRWTRQLELTATRDRLPGLERVGPWLYAHLPESQEATIVHGDFGLHNMILSPVRPVTVQAVLDWEMATIGDPLADVVWFLRGWGEVPTRNPANYVTAMPGALSEQDMLARYEDASGRKIHDKLFYQVFSGWKGAIILEGLYASYLEGNAANENVARFAEEVPQGVEHLLSLIRT